MIYLTVLSLAGTV